MQANIIFMQWACGPWASIWKWRFLEVSTQRALSPVMATTCYRFRGERLGAQRKYSRLCVSSRRSFGRGVRRQTDAGLCCSSGRAPKRVTAGRARHGPQTQPLKAHADVGVWLLRTPKLTSLHPQRVLLWAESVDAFSQARSKMSSVNSTLTECIWVQYGHWSVWRFGRCFGIMTLTTHTHTHTRIISIFKNHPKSWGAIKHSSPVPMDLYLFLISLFTHGSESSPPPPPRPHTPTRRACLTLRSADHTCKRITRELLMTSSSQIGFAPRCPYLEGAWVWMWAFVAV